MEIWRDIKGYEGIYQISNLGRVKSLKKTFYNSNSKTSEYVYRKKLLKQQTIRGGYKRIMLHDNNVRKTYLIHRLVAQAFIPNPNNYPIIHHKDTITDNNKVSNLEWSTLSNNTIEGYRVGNMKKHNKLRAKTMAKTFSKKVYQYDLEGNFIKEWNSLHDVYRKLGYTIGNISNCCLGKQKTSRGYVWKYER